MTARYNAVNARAELLGDGFGWQRMRVQTPTPPLGTKQAIYVMRIETDLAADVTDAALSWNAAAYFGFKFDANFPSSSETGLADYDNFFGAAMGDDAPTSNSAIFNFSSTTNPDTVWFGNTIGGDPAPQFYDGNGGVELTDDGNADDFALAVSASATPGVVTYVWRIYSHPTDNSILYEMWLNTESKDLTTFDIANDMDPQDPKAFFPVWASTLRTGTIHGDTFGTNWRPSDGVMGFPTYFMACHPGRTFNMHIPYVGVQYSTLTA